MKSSLRRWADIFGYSVIAALLALPIGKVLQGLVHGFAGILFQASTPSFILSLGIYLAALWVIIQKCGLFRIRHFLHFLSYPPVLASIPISLGMIDAILFINPSLIGKESRYQFWETGFILVTEIIALLVTGVFALGFIASGIFKSKGQKRVVRNQKDYQTRDIFSMSDTELFEWLSTETPIDHVSQDFFGASERARSVAEALLKDRKDRNGKKLRQTVVIQGEFGSGKSSIVTLVEGMIREKSNETFIFVRVPCWGFSSVAAQEHILESVIIELSREVDCLGLRPVPTDYVEAVSKMNSWIGAALRFFSVAPKPVDHLKRLTPVLEAINGRLVVIIEDTDRNGPDFDQKHIEAMLHNFREVERVSFVLTAGSKSQIDFPKIAEYILFLPTLPKENILTIIDKARNHFRKNIPFIDPMMGNNMSSGRRIESLINESDSGQVTFYMSGGLMWADALASLLNTPRKLKKTISQIVTGWDKLHGEVDIDELIMITALRCCAPAAFTVFGNHFQQLKNIFQKRDGKYDLIGGEWQKERGDFVKGSWSRAVSESNYDPEVLGAIISALSPWGASMTGVINLGRTKRCQSIDSERSPVYWERLVTEHLNENEVRDQEVLSIVTKANDEKGIEELGIRAGTSQKFAGMVLFFRKNSESIISDSCMLKAAAIALQHSGPFESRSFAGEISSYRTIIRWLHTIIQYGDSSFTEWLKEQMLVCFPNRLRDLTTLFGDTHKLLIEGGGREIRQWLLEQCKTRFLSLSPKEFSSFFDNSDPYALGHLIRIDNNNSDWLFARGKDWFWLAPMLLKCMEECPHVMVPQVMMIFGEYGPGGAIPTFFNYNEGELEDLFGTELRLAVTLLTQPLDISEETEAWFKLAAHLGTKKAEEWKLRLEQTLDALEIDT